MLCIRKSHSYIRKNNSNWIELIVKDNFDFTVKLQYSKKMRVSDINYDVGDNLFIYALIISSEKTINQKKRSYFNLIVEDMINKTNLKQKNKKTAKNKFGSFFGREPINSNSFS